MRAGWKQRAQDLCYLVLIGDNQAAWRMANRLWCGKDWRDHT